MAKSEWKRIENFDGEKYELKHNGSLLGTIYHKPKNGKFAVWFSSPIIVKKMTSMLSESHEFKTLDEAKQQFDIILREKILGWANSVIDYLKE